LSRVQALVSYLGVALDTLYRVVLRIAVLNYESTEQMSRDRTLVAL
jgi:hypothetical protein